MARAAQQLELKVTATELVPGEARVTPALTAQSHSSRPASKPELPRLALTFAESAATLGVSDEFFAQHVALELRFVRRGRKKLVAVNELERWLRESAARQAL